jgi:hypothetical protein
VFWSLARTTRSVVPFRFCLVEVALLIVTSTEFWMNGVPSPGANCSCEPGGLVVDRAAALGVRREDVDLRVLLVEQQTGRVWWSCTRP